jgi:nitroimidazol reductase NimA-like FMN-containing flavoprotein (pyridoxamine 5'-phosphate oxidase superfamily)
MDAHRDWRYTDITDYSVIQEILSSTDYITVAMCKDNTPYLVSLSHGYDKENNCLYFHCANHGKKITYLTTNKMVWGQTVIYQRNRGYTSVMFSGDVVFLESTDEKMLAMQTIIRQRNKNSKPLIEKLEKSNIFPTLVMGKIAINFTSGKKAEKKIFMK